MSHGGFKRGGGMPIIQQDKTSLQTTCTLSSRSLPCLHFTL